MSKIKKTLALILAVNILTSLNSVVSANTSLGQIEEMLNSGKSTMEVLEELAKTDEYNDISCKITVKPGTVLTKLEESHHVEESPYEDIYYVNGSPQILMRYGNLENVISIEIRFPQNDSEYKKDQIALFKKILNEPYTEDNAPYLILDLDDSANIEEILISDSTVLYSESFPENQSKRYYIQASNEVLRQYLEWYESEDIPLLKAFTITVPATLGYTGEVFYPIGDINHDTFIDVTDLTELSLFLLGDSTLSKDRLMFADVDGDGEINLADLARLQQYLSKKIDKL